MTRGFVDYVREDWIWAIVIVIVILTPNHRTLLAHQCLIHRSGTEERFIIEMKDSQCNLNSTVIRFYFMFRGSHVHRTEDGLLQVSHVILLVEAFKTSQ